MNAIPLFRKAKPGSLAAALSGTRPTLPLDEEIGQAVGNWVAHDQTTSRLAEPVAEPYLHAYLEHADRIGAAHGRAACVVIWWPLTALLLVVALILI